ncbi:hypothetical protein GNI_038060 [Gregarina niphandrodes]|uniref:Uncharacterized protein n=1 Tax=Gregarina niphandrodes TaxID=110365 RepID=A0A023BAI2_GRENI|nr:hypothetical protein GNI_038060 [Gregarina niphandrodes]EZG78316.1 hypothetical protein GNI_038060 [Gregarina niphandrodes]|eukprot:XP_011129343.1 hypothetical protein GNI_038060 [Gregarina niphandrodes]
MLSGDQNEGVSMAHHAAAVASATARVPPLVINAPPRRDPAPTGLFGADPSSVGDLADDALIPRLGYNHKVEPDKPIDIVFLFVHGASFSSKLFDANLKEFLGCLTQVNDEWFWELSLSYHIEMIDWKSCLAPYQFKSISRCMPIESMYESEDGGGSPNDDDPALNRQATVVQAAGMDPVRFGSRLGVFGLDDANTPRSVSSRRCSAELVTANETPRSFMSRIFRWNSDDSKKEKKSRNSRSGSDDLKINGLQGEALQGETPQGQTLQGGELLGERSQGERPQGERPQGERPQGERPQGERPQGEGPGPGREGVRAKTLGFAGALEGLLNNVMRSSSTKSKDPIDQTEDLVRMSSMQPVRVGSHDEPAMVPINAAAAAGDSPITSWS